MQQRLIYKIGFFFALFCIILPHIAETKLGDSSKHIADIADIWWKRLPNYDSEFYQEINIGYAIVHLCGSRKIIERKSGQPPQKSTYMFTSFNGEFPAHIWLLIKVTANGKIVFHKWAVGHEFVRFLDLLSIDILDPGKYGHSSSPF